jgi:uncharacterized membrane protein YgcG
VGQDADAIRHDIELTRERMSERADALAYKADVPARTKDKVLETKDNLMSAVTGKANDMKSAIAGATPDRAAVADQAQHAKGLAESNPLGLAIGAVALGFLAGLVVPTTKIENERLGPAADELKSKAKDLGQEALEHGKQVASEVADAAKQTAQEAGQEHAAELKSAVSGGDDGDSSESGSDGAYGSSGSSQSGAGDTWSASPTAGTRTDLG